jgi:predicted glycoside hydrolase/deacetylase ChbG (UPF0249 family)
MMTSTTQRMLIVNADDFGLSPGVNRGIIAAHERGIVTSASLMVRWPAAPAAASYARAHRGLGVGLHLDLGEWAFRNGRWVALYEVVPPDADQSTLEAEVRRQLDEFRRLTRAEPTHVDSHQHVHRARATGEVVRRMAEELGVPLRHFSAARYCGSFYGQTGEGDPLADAVSVDALLRVIADLPPGPTELCCHPGEAEPELDTMYRAERSHEVAALCDPRVRDALDRAGVELRSFRTWQDELISR